MNRTKFFLLIGMIISSLLSVQAAQKIGLIRAVQSGDLECVDSMTDDDTVNQQDEKTRTTPLHEAVKLKDRKAALQIAEILLKRGANVMAEDKNGRIPSDLAFLSQFHAMNTLLMEYGAPDHLQVTISNPVSKL